MIGYDKVPWRAVHEYLLRIESAPTLDEFLSCAVSGVDRLIPVDAGSLIDVSGRMVSGCGWSDSVQAVFNDYYRFRIPFIPDQRFLEEVALRVQTVEWSDYRDSEFVTDFARPNRMVHNIIRYEPGFRIAYSLHRSAQCSMFSEKDRATLAVLSPHLSNLYSCFQKLEQSASFTVCKEQVRERFPQISQREAEISILLCHGLTASEIASKLFISRRTVERHVENLYDKLNVHDKKTAIERLTSRMQTPTPQRSPDGTEDASVIRPCY